MDSEPLISEHTSVEVSDDETEVDGQSNHK